MLLSDVDIANLALGRIGKFPIMNFNERTNEAANCKIHYPFAVLETLCAFDWPCARKYRTLTLYDEIDMVHDWLYAYSVPPDCLTVQSLSHSGQETSPIFALYMHPDPDRTEQILLTNREDAILIYTTQTITANRFTPDLASAIAWNLAAKVAMPITRDKAMQDIALKQYKEALSGAQTSSANEEPEHFTEPTPDWITDHTSG